MQPMTNVRSSDRVFVLKLKDGEKAKDSTGLVDTRLFQGGNNLHAVRDGRTNFWSFRYEKGGLPPALKGKSFTKFDNAYNYAKQYLDKRGIEITEVKD
jgi:hypothetical protein